MRVRPGSFGTSSLLGLLEPHPPHLLGLLLPTTGVSEWGTSLAAGCRGPRNKWWSGSAGAGLGQDCGKLMQGRS